MPDQWKSITGLVELEQHVSTELPEPPIENLADPPVKSNGSFAGGLLIGIGAAILGLVITFFFDLFTEFGLICYLAPAVGWLIGKAIRKGSRGAGGLRYQIAAIILTYFATALPTTSYYFFFAEQKIAQQAHMWLAPGWERLYARCAISGSLSPFLSVQRGVIDIIGLAILFAGLYVTYRMTVAGTDSRRSRFETWESGYLPVMKVLPEHSQGFARLIPPNKNASVPSGVRD